MRRDRKLCAAIETLRPHPDFQLLIDAIREDVRDAFRATATAEGTPLYRAQGKVQALQELLEVVEKAREWLEKPGLK